MSDHETRLSRREAERLLDAPAAHGSALGWALSEANAPAYPAELRREDATLAAFHTARLTPSPTTRSAFVSPTRLGSRAAARAVIATGAVVALTVGGIALANSALLPSLPDQASDQATEAIDAAAETSESTETSTDSTDSTDSTESEVEAETSADSATPTPNFRGLCTAFQAADHSAHGRSLDSAAFLALAAEAGATGAGRAEQIATYCAKLVGQPKKTGKPSELPTPTSKPTDKPSGKPSVLPTPTDKPRPAKPGSAKPSPAKPTDKPDQSGTDAGEDSTTSGS